jgi:hypothetical protein
MSDVISFYNGINPRPTKDVTWQYVLSLIKDGEYKNQVNKAREIKNPDEYRKFKTNLDSVTFAGTFNSVRNKDHVLSTTGLIIPDLDHIKDVDKIFNQIVQDEKTWFAFRSPSGEGIKCGFRARGIRNDDDHKVFFKAVYRYFKFVYGIDIDPSCKDISRLTFLSFDEQTYINPSPIYFNIEAWKEVSPLTPKPFDHKKYDTRKMAGKQKYAAKVLESCCDKIRSSVKGTQHCVRLSMSRLIGGYMAYLSEGTVLAELEAAVRDSGAENIKAAMKTVRDGLEYGKANPIEIEDIVSGPIYTNLEDVTDVTLVTDESVCNASSRPVTGLSHLSRSQDARNPLPYGSMINNLRIFCEQNQGATFTSADFDREFGITHPADKAARRQALARAIKKEKIIIQDKQRTGVYTIPKSDVEFIDILNTSSDSFPITIPFSLTEMVNIPKRSVIVVAGTKNAGKTALSLNIIKENLDRPHQLLYLMSEMGPSEYKKRVEQLGVDLKAWQGKVKAADIPAGFGQVIAAHNPRGITVIDYLEDVGGEYFKIASDIRSIYDALDEGVVIICLQKHSQANVGRGGEATLEKARLYLTLDLLAHQPRYSISALKVISAKDYPDENPNGKELHIKIIRGHEIEPMDGFGDWKYCNQAQRAAYLRGYEHMADRDFNEPATGGRAAVVVFQKEDGTRAYLEQKDYEKWEDAYPYIQNLKSELEGLSRWSEKHPLRKNWFHQMSGILAKKNEKAKQNGNPPF